MKNNILLHGATNCGSSNYGDYIYGEMLFNYFKDKDYNIGFYQPSKYFEEYLSKNVKNIVMDKKNADYIIYIPGGYFGESSNPRMKENIVHFLRFLPLGIWGAFHKKKMLVIGIGAGPINNIFLKYGISKICNHSLVITVRDSVSFKALNDLCPKANIIECGDLILTKKLPITNTNQIENIINEAQGKKILFVHYNHSTDALNKFALSVNKFIKQHPDYYVVVGSDCILSNDDELYEKFYKESNVKSFHYKYSNPSEFTMLLSKVDLVLTTKLHTGVISCTFNKSVVSVACHYEKTSRFYNQINQSERCVELKSVSEKEIYVLLERFYDSKIYIPTNIIDDANKSWSLLEKYIED